MPPIATGFILGTEALGGLLMGAVASGFMLAIMMASAGGAWDNAKKYVELGHYGGKGSEPHKAAVEGDLVGDPFKGHLGSISEHPAETDGHSLPGVRPGVPGR